MITNNVAAVTSTIEERDTHGESNPDISTWETLPSKVCIAIYYG